MSWKGQAVETSWPVFFFDDEDVDVGIAIVMIFGNS